MSLSNVRFGFIVAGLMNLVGVPAFSLGFTNTYLSELYPSVFSAFGLLMIMVWGLAYIAAADAFVSVPWICVVFAIEKVIYAFSWVVWMARHHGELPQVFARSSITGTFYAIYGLSDLAFAVLFGYAAGHAFRTRSSAR